MQVIPAGLRANSSAVLAVLLWSLAISGLSAARYSFDHYSQEQGLGNSLVRAIQQDRAGFLWVATKAGLYRFDGVRFQLFSPFDGSTPETIRDVHVDRAGTLWVVTNQTLAKLVGQRFQTVPLGSGGGARFSLASDSKGSIYVATPKGLLVWKGQGEVTALGPAGLTAEGPVHGVWVGSDDVLWYGCGQAICRWDGTEARVYGTTDGVPAANWGSFARDKSGNLWARGGDRLAMQRQGESQFRPDRNFSHPGTGRILVDGRGRLVVPAEDGIWMRAESGQWEQIHEEEGLPSNRVNCVFEDREGSLWIGFADLGLARWRGNGDWKGFTRQDGLSSSEITGIASNKDGTLWVGSRKGLNRRDPLTGAWRLLTSRDGLSADDVRALAVTPNGYVWVASREHGLARLDPRTLRAEPAHTAQCRTLCQIISLTVDDTGTLWVATRQGVFSSRQIETGSAEFQPAFSAQLLPGEQVYRVRRDTHGRMWLAGTRGLHFEGPAGWTRLTASDGLLSNTVTFLTVNEDDSAWVGYGEFLGVSRLRWVDGELKIDHYNKDNRLFSNDICFL
ncbi:MAG: hypothetical protein HY248_04855, partial [Fimbriimonas ginsengisoli]|nr:hypothetical protein [Fimbriimonas ginsengisoli]